MNRIIYRIKIKKVKNELKNNIDWFIAYIDNGRAETSMGFPTLKEAVNFITEEVT